MKSLDYIKKRGSVDALKGHINALIHEITQSIWRGGIYKDSKFDVGRKLDQVEVAVNNIRDALAELNNLEPGHK